MLNLGVMMVLASAWALLAVWWMFLQSMHRGVDSAIGEGHEGHLSGTIRVNARA